MQDDKDAAAAATAAKVEASSRQDANAASVQKKLERARRDRETAAVETNGDEQLAFQRLKKLVARQTRQGDAQSTDAMLMGFVRATKGDTFKALGHWERWVGWRAEFVGQLEEQAYVNGSSYKDNFVQHIRKERKADSIRVSATPWKKDRTQRLVQHTKAFSNAEDKLEEFLEKQKLKRDKQFEKAITASDARRASWAHFEDKEKHRDRPASPPKGPTVVWDRDPLPTKQEERLATAAKNVLPPWRHRPATNSGSSCSSRTNSSRRGSFASAKFSIDSARSEEEVLPVQVLPRSYLNRIAN